MSVSSNAHWELEHTVFIWISFWTSWFCYYFSWLFVFVLSLSLSRSFGNSSYLDVACANLGKMWRYQRRIQKPVIPKTEHTIGKGKGQKKIKYWAIVNRQNKPIKKFKKNWATRITQKNREWGAPKVLAVHGTLVVPDGEIWWYLMDKKRAGLWVRQEYIRFHLW